MSQYLFNGNSRRLVGPSYATRLSPSVRATAPYTLDAQYGPRYSDILWPRSRYTGNDPAASLVSAEVFPRVTFWWIDRPVGAGGWAHISGITKDSAGVALGGCSVHVYRTSDDLERDQVTSDAGDGTYTIGVDTDSTHYCVAYKPGSPDVAGTTVNTLTGS